MFGSIRVQTSLEFFVIGLGCLEIDRTLARSTSRSFIPKTRLAKEKEAAQGGDKPKKKELSPRQLELQRKRQERKEEAAVKQANQRLIRQQNRIKKKIEGYEAHLREKETRLQRKLDRRLKREQRRQQNNEKNEKQGEEQELIVDKDEDSNVYDDDGDEQQQSDAHQDQVEEEGEKAKDSCNINNDNEDSCLVI